MPNYATGVIPSPKDPRDLKVLPAPRSLVIPRQLSLRPGLQPIRDQGQEGTCVGHAVTTCMGYWQRTRNTPGQGAPDDEILSPRDSYFTARRRLPVIGDGAQPRAALKSVQQEGVLTEKVAPYRPGQRDWAPPAGPGVDVVGDRARNRIRTYRGVPTNQLRMLAEAIAQHGPLLYTLPTDDAFFSARPGEVVRPGGAKGGWHAVTACGYDLDKGVLELANSYGTSWGDQGFCLYDPSANDQGEAYSMDPEDVPGLAFVPLLERVGQAIMPWAFLNA